MVYLEGKELDLYEPLLTAMAQVLPLLIYQWFVIVAWTTTSQPLTGSNSQEYVPPKKLP